MNISNKLIIACALLTTAFGCGRAPAPEAAKKADNVVPPALAAIFRPVEPPATAVTIAELRQTAKPGDNVVVDASIIGAEKPFVDKRAVFIIGDPNRLETCDTREGDTCPTPWDACCDDPRVLRENTATVQIVDGEGRVLPYGLRGIGGLREMSRVRIAGVVAPQSDGDSLVINATEIHVL